MIDKWVGGEGQRERERGRERGRGGERGLAKFRYGLLALVLKTFIRMCQNIGTKILRFLLGMMTATPPFNASLNFQKYQLLKWHLSFLLLGVFLSFFRPRSKLPFSSIEYGEITPGLQPACFSADSHLSYQASAKISCSRPRRMILDPSFFPSPSGLKAVRGQGKGLKPTTSVTCTAHTGPHTVFGMERSFRDMD